MRNHFFTFLKYEKYICKWYEKLTKNSKLDREKTKKQTKNNNNNDKKKNTPSYSQRQGQHYDIYKKYA